MKRRDISPMPGKFISSAVRSALCVARLAATKFMRSVWLDIVYTISWPEGGNRNRATRRISLKGKKLDSIAVEKLTYCDIL
jgi:hypothetical protein